MPTQPKPRTKTRTAAKPKTAGPEPKGKARGAKPPAGYSGTPLPKKLGIHPDSRVGLIGAPTNLEQLLVPLPLGATLLRSARGSCDLFLWFPRDARELGTHMRMRAERLGKDGIWICWPKKASGMATDLSENLIRDTGLAAGLVDFKVCAVDVTYSGLKFTYRKSPPGSARRGD
jgi:hypothetical protein